MNELSIIICSEDLDTFDFNSLESVGFRDLFTNYRMAVNVTYEVLLIETLHRFGTCLFEVGLKSLTAGYSDLAQAPLCPCF